MTSVTADPTDQVPSPDAEDLGLNRHRRGLHEHRPLVYALRGVVLALALGSWQLLANARVIDPFFVSKPSLIARRFWDWITNGYLLSNLWVTVQETLLALVIGVLGGAVFGYLLARWRLGDGVLLPYLNMMNAIPRLILTPLFLLWFGIGMASKIAMGVSLVFFVVFFNMYQGVKSVDKVLINNAIALGASEAQLRRHVLLPSALSWIFASLHLAVSFAILGAVMGEFIGASKGIGYIIAQAQGVIDATGMLTGIVVIALFVLLFEAVAGLAERRLLRWKP